MQLLVSDCVAHAVLTLGQMFPTCAPVSDSLAAADHRDHCGSMEQNPASSTSAHLLLCETPFIPIPDT